ncbi:MAG: aldo/keto reductase [Anaerovoracaceae bacterium]
MEKIELGNTGLMVTKIGFGVLVMGRNQLNLPVKEGAEVLRYALEAGINFLDTAQYYETYPYIKEALKDHTFDPVIASKCLDPSYSQMKFAVEEARREMDRDVIDIFMLHEVRSKEDFLQRTGAWEYLQEAKSKGIVKAIGISTHHIDVALMTAEIPQADVLFPIINFRGMGIRKGDKAGSKEEMAQAIEKNHRNGKGVFAMKVFGGGPLAGHYHEALNYVAGLTGIDSIMIGFGHKREVDPIIQYLNGSLTEDYSPDLSGKRIFIDQGDCEGCGDCISRCPNHAIYRNTNGLAEIDYTVCLNCGYCAPVCPVRAIIMIG